MNSRLATFLLWILLCSRANGQVKVPSFFADHMVVQQNHPLWVWGTAAPGERISVRLARLAAVTKADASGHWTVNLGSLQASNRGHTLSIRGAKEKLQFEDVLVGEVWLCSGQSNMVWRVDGCDGAEEAKKQARDTRIRMYTGTNRSESSPQFDVPGEWLVAAPQTVGRFSGTAYYFGRELLQALDVPIGLVNVSWGGSTAQAWMSHDALMQCAAAERTLTEYEEYMRVLDADPGQWIGPKVEVREWSTATLPTTFAKMGHDIDGIIWFRHKVKLPRAWLGKPLLLQLGKIDDQDQTWFNGKPVGSERNHNDVRSYEVPAEFNRERQAVIAVKVQDGGGRGGFWSPPEELSLSLQGKSAKPISLAGDWHYQVASQAVPAPAQHRPAHLFNGMIHPLLDYAIRGVIWYQGENNAMIKNSFEYIGLFPNLIADWRTHFNDEELPFYFVQLPNFGYAPGRFWDYETVRDAQLRTYRSVPHTGMAITIDIGDAKDIHPRNKSDVGKRLARWALADTYGFKDVVASGPIYKAVRFIPEGKAEIEFDLYGSPLKVRGGGQEIAGFMMAGEDKKFHPATGRLEDGRVIVHSSAVPIPVSVRYAWEGDPHQANLINTEDLPAAPFRTDDWNLRPR